MPLDWVGPLLLCDEELRRIPLRIPGVYILHGLSQRRGHYVVLYAGQSADLRSRLVQHLRTKGTSSDVVYARTIARLYFSAAPVLETIVRHRIEAGLVGRLRPPFNRQVPCSSPILPSLPTLALEPLAEEIS